uniref:hypothetical protein n=1 Tax=Geminicoccus roseus TaxID=404900 RepID=UPI0012FAFD6A
MTASFGESGGSQFLREGFSAVRAKLEAVLGGAATIELHAKADVREATIRHGCVSWTGQGETFLDTLEDAARQVALSLGSAQIVCGQQVGEEGTSTSATTSAGQMLPRGGGMHLGVRRPPTEVDYISAR